MILYRRRRPNASLLSPEHLTDHRAQETHSTKTRVHEEWRMEKETQKKMVVTSTSWCSARWCRCLLLRNAGARPQRRGAQQWLTDAEEHWPRLTHLYRATEDPSKVPLGDSSWEWLVLRQDDTRPQRLTYFLFRFLATRSYRLLRASGRERLCRKRETQRASFSSSFLGKARSTLTLTAILDPLEDEQHFATLRVFAL